MPRSALLRRRDVSAVLIAAAAAPLNTVLVQLNHAAGHPLLLDTVLTGIAAAACGPVVGIAAGLLSTLTIWAVEACGLYPPGVFMMNALAGLLIGLMVPWNREITPGRLLLAVVALVLVTTAGDALVIGDVVGSRDPGGLNLIRTTYRLFGIAPPWPQFFYLLPLNLADKMLTVGAAVLVGPLLGSYRARWVAGAVGKRDA